MERGEDAAPAAFSPLACAQEVGLLAASAWSGGAPASPGRHPPPATAGAGQGNQPHHDIAPALSPASSRGRANRSPAASSATTWTASPNFAGLWRKRHVFLSGGSSKGTRDHTIAALERIPGTEILAHGVRISPGKPTILARAAGKAVVGLPGQVGSAQVVMTVLGQPFLRHLAGDREAFAERLRPLRRARLARNLESRQGREDFVRVRLQPTDGGLPLAQPVLGKSGLRLDAAGDGLLVIPADVRASRRKVDVSIL
jgi:hypothetical protein